jgi:hypothetical protein|tara:strand:- start:644 stop:1903 length:1260 start_codon:yes stop_codon:yes gene_type:complete
VKKHILSFHIIIIFIGMLYLYGSVSHYFEYWGFTYDLSFNRVLLSIASLLLITNVFLNGYIYDFVQIFLIYWAFFVIIPITILFSVSVINYYHFFLHFSFICIIGLLFTLKRQLVFAKNLIKPISFEHNKFLIVLFSLILSIPLLEVVANFNFLSFNLFDVYDIRKASRESSNTIIGYLKEALSRVVYPFFMIYGYVHKKLFLLIFGLLGIIVVFASTGALKSIIAVIPISFLFIKTVSYKQIQKLLLVLVYCLVFIPIIETYLFGTFFLTDLPSRRLFFVPGLLENSFLLEYTNNPQLYMHSILKFFNDNPEALARNIGNEYFDRPDMNANVGVLLDGFINIGYFGVILHAIIIYFTIGVLNGVKINPKFFGIFFVYFYYINTSFIGTLFLTHGMFFLLVFFYITKLTHENPTHLSKF